MRQFEFSPTTGLLATIEGSETHPDLQGVVLREGPEFQAWTNLTPLGDRIVDVAFSSDGCLLAALSPDAVRIWECQAERLEADGSLPVGESRVIAGFTADGEHLLLVDQDHTVLVWSVEQESIQDTWSAGGEAHPPPGYFDARSLAFHPASGTLVLGGVGSASVWDITSHTRRGSLQGHGIWRVEPSISPDGKLIVTLGESGDKQVRIWDSYTLGQIGELETPPHPILCLAFSPDRRRLAVGRYKYGDIGIYDTETGIQILAIPPALTDISLRCQWSPNGSTFAVLGTGGGILWRTPPGPVTSDPL